MTLEEPAGPGTTAELFAEYLAYYRAEVIHATGRLTASELRASLLPSGWTPIELVSHLVHMEQRWFVWGFLGEHVEHPWGDWTVDEDPWAAGSDARWQVPESTALVDLTDALTGVGERTTEVLRTHPLQTPAQPGPRWPAEVRDLRWICFHVLQEYARHAGHLDIAVELAEARR